MENNNKADKNQVNDLFNKLSSFQTRGYFLNHDENFTKAIITGLLFNETRYGYQSCPCRLASGDRIKDLDIICPCDYRDADVAEYGACLCGLYISKKAYLNKEKVKPAPERRPREESKNKITYMDPVRSSGFDGKEYAKNLIINNMETSNGVKNDKKQLADLSYPVLRCKVCGYICARAEAPDTCPICGADKDRFERFI